MSEGSIGFLILIGPSVIVTVLSYCFVRGRSSIVDRLVKRLVRVAFSWICYASLALQSLAASSDTASDRDAQFSFSAPAGWRLFSTGRTYVYSLYQVTRGMHPNCPVSVSSQIGGASLAEEQDEAIARVRRIYSGPDKPVVRRQELRSIRGVCILKAEVRFGTYLQPGLKRGKGFLVRCVLYTCRGGHPEGIYNLVCYPQRHHGAFFDTALDDMAKSIGF